MLTKGRVPILCYHSVSDAPSVAGAEFRVRPGTLARQLRFLQRQGYRSMTLNEVIAAFEAGAPLEKAVVLTFDDGYRDNVTIAAPLLRDHGFRATLFVVNEFVGRSNTIFSDDLATWDEIQSLRDHGWEIGLHSATHPDLRTLDPSRLRQEILDARGILEQRLGAGVSSFAYPWGKYTAAVADMVRLAGFRTAVTVSHSLASATSDRYALPRCAMRGTDSMLDFMLTVRTGYGVGSALRFARRSLGA